jgi:hypothetical protein
MDRAVLGSSLTTTGVFAGFLIEHDRFADILVEKEDSGTYFNTAAAADAGILINHNTHSAISSRTIAASSGNMIS